MAELINLFAVLWFVFLAGMFFVITIRELKCGETLIKTCFMAGVCCAILACLQAAVDGGIIDKNLFVISIITDFIVYLAITFYAYKYVESTKVYR